jgi:hypothetical protein
VDEDTVRRLRWLAPLGLAATLVAGWAVGPAAAYRPSKPLPSPVFAGDDALSAVLVTGTHYSARFTVSLPADWPVEADSDVGSVAIVLMVARGRLRDNGIAPAAALYCSSGYPNAAGTTVTLVCPLTAPEPGPFDLTVSAGTSLLQAFGSSEATVDDTLHVYHHTVVAAQ